MCTGNVGNILERKPGLLPLNITCTDPENLNVLHTRKGATRSFDVTDLGQEAVRIQGSDRPMKKLNFDVRLQGFAIPDYMVVPWVSVLVCNRVS